MIDRANPAPSPLPCGDSALIFLVDDEQDLGEMLGAMLELEGFQVQVFTHPQRALEALQSAHQRPDVLATDYSMDGMNGMELIQSSKGSFPNLRTILFSANVKADVINGYMIKPDDFLAKPFTGAALSARLRSVLQRSAEPKG